jgi:Holliday junction DNA helicase RuvA
MIGRLTGTLVEKNPPQLLLDVQGVAYEVDVPMSTFTIFALGERIALFTHLVVREDAHLLFGFGTEHERRAFRQLVKISGVGARTALSVLSGLSVAELAQAVTMQDAGRLTKIPGIGKKTAERLLLELKDKLGADVTTAVGVHRPPPASSDVLNALLALGYSDKEAVARSSSRWCWRGRRHPSGPEAAGESLGATWRSNTRAQPARHAKVPACRRRWSSARFARLLDEYVGQEKIRDQLSIFIEAARSAGSARPRAAVRPAGTRQDDTAAHHRARAWREPAPDVGSGARTRRRPGGASPTSSRTTCCSSTRYTGSPGGRGDPVSGARGFSDRHHDRRRARSAQRQARSAALHLVGATTRAGISPTAARHFGIVARLEFYTPQS